MINIETFFQLDKNGTDLKTEIMAGITTFLTMSYIIIINPAILSTGEHGIPFAGALTATILVSSLSCILMGLYANLPYALAPGMGINAFFTFSVVLGMGVSWQTALGTVFISGIIFLFLSIFKVREMIVYSIPECIRYGVAAGIGLFLSLIGLKEAGFITSSPATLVRFAGFNSNVIVFLSGLAITSILVIKKIRGALLAGIIMTATAAFTCGRLWGETVLVTIPDQFFKSPDFSSAFFQLDIAGALQLSMLGVVFTFLFTDMFDSISTFLGVAQVAGLKDSSGQPKNIRQALIVDAVSTTISGLFGSSSGTTYIESAAGVEAGGRTGLTAVVAGLLFLPFLYLSPLVSMIPMLAVSPVLVLVGFYMMSAVRQIDFKNMSDSIPAFIALILIPLTYSITQGISWSFLFYIIIRLSQKRHCEIPLMLYVITFFSLIALTFI